MGAPPAAACCCAGGAAAAGTGGCTGGAASGSSIWGGMRTKPAAVRSHQLTMARRPGLKVAPESAVRSAVRSASGLGPWPTSGRGRYGWVPSAMHLSGNWIDSGTCQRLGWSSTQALRGRGSKGHTPRPSTEGVCCTQRDVGSAVRVWVRETLKTGIGLWD